MIRWERAVPWAAAALACLYVLIAALPPGDGPGEMRIREFGRIPIVHQGRVKPFDTLARTSLTKISGRDSYVNDAGRSVPAIRWLLDMLSAIDPDDPPTSEQALQRIPVLGARVFRIDHDQVLNVLRLSPRSGFRYSYLEVGNRSEVLQDEAERAASHRQVDRDIYEHNILELMDKVRLFQRLIEIQIPHVVPPQSVGDEWKPYDEARVRSQVTGIPDPVAESLARLLSAFRAGNVEAFNAEVDRYRSLMEKHMPEDTGRAGFETFFNSFSPFTRAPVLYVAGFLLVLISWLIWGSALRRSGVGVVAIALVVHSFALVARMYIQDRWPVFVTNLYSSAIFIGWAGVILGLVLEKFYRDGIGTAMGSVAGFVTLLIAFNLGRSGDSLEMMQAVLDTNFWLATHVTVVTLGYASTYLAGLLGIVYVLRGLLTYSLSAEASRSMARMIYGIVCFGTLFSFTGTVLGGIWADQSWGRFWGWDPKENGALIIVLWNALVLHARWGGMIRDRGLAVLAVVGNIVTSWSWFGVNMMGVGLHAYGFMGSGPFWLGLFVAGQLAVIGAGLIPKGRWRSFAAEG